MALNQWKNIRWLQRIGIVATGHAAKQAEEWGFDYVLYPAVLVWLGPLWGGAAMMVLSAFVCWVYILVYDRMQTDWFGLELVKELRDTKSTAASSGRLLSKVLRWGNVPAFFALTFFTDPFMTTAYLRHGASRYQGLARRDWAIFWSSVVIGNAAWTGILSGIIVGIKWLWNLLS